MDGLEEDAAQHGPSLAALIAVLVDEGAEVSHSGTQVLIQLEVCWNLHCYLISLQENTSPNVRSQLIPCDSFLYSDGGGPGHGNSVLVSSMTWQGN